MGDERFQRAGAGGELWSRTIGSVAAAASCGSILNYYFLF